VVLVRFVVLLARMAVRGAAAVILLQARLLLVVLVIRHQLHLVREITAGLVHQLIFMALAVAGVRVLMVEMLLSTAATEAMDRLLPYLEVR
jgi:hypothetical protein